ncbi:MAG: hypothetical protein A2087_04825 [Spirochaetes bacterium GWD1_61_31]|nr:MAG: hypothetical protein A2Y37_01635 [Spirochaetes bacterium GWB1_60_80]OHD34916.1 MAG: hypothetical protein A2004_00665 [Spirochaetes bacterium GWC1_61_12]OHD37055.1 MAG: hypothetical protein A2087_04825 [Spirochaetes bacterium GWD1_61_31]OHD45335.1 MAG: hypothetical protein A2Y35_00565 [Spirochaetes bacterium GWE1_60_18]OHD61087.1 MAG: hypothetical protein A2Y32_09250 [Spirochaetes bacterium GWF1_60_12]HAP42748.1 magnesium chelatase [Spirochaetaceae bacterium]
MQIYSYEPLGYGGQLVKVEVDIRRGIPTVDIVGLPDGAIKEARDRIRAALRNAGHEFPLDKVLVNLAPAGLRKGGAAFDLSIALAILVASGQLPDLPLAVLAVGELELSGQVRPVPGVLPAVAEAHQAGIEACIVPPANWREAAVLAGDRAWALPDMAQAVRLCTALRGGEAAADYRLTVQAPCLPGAATPLADPAPSFPDWPDFSELRGQTRLRRAMEICAAGGHHALLFGPPGAGKTMAAQRFPGLLPPLDEAVAIETSKIHSLAGIMPAGAGLLRWPAFRAPHHGASAEGIVGGGKQLKPGEISLAHGGVLFLDEAPEFRSDVLQALREPLEAGYISITRADRTVRYPSRFTLLLACNPCPCGNLGRGSSVCLCSADEIRRYWKRLGAPLLDRVDIRVPLQPASAAELAGGPAEGSAAIRQRVSAARAIQAKRYRGQNFTLNGQLGTGAIDRHCLAGLSGAAGFFARVEADGLSARAWHSVLRVARTIADLAGQTALTAEHLEEALAFRRYGDEDWFWQLP